MQTPNRQETDPEVKSIAKILSSSRLTHIIQKAKQLSQLNLTLQAILDPELQSHCEVANFAEDTLILHVSDGMWATRIRYSIPQLISALKNQPGLEGLKKITCKVRVS